MRILLRAVETTRNNFKDLFTPFIHFDRIAWIMKDEIMYLG
jgi:hypothetical protein